MRSDRVFVRRIYNKSTHSKDGWNPVGDYNFGEKLALEERSALYVLPYKPSGGGIPYHGMCSIGAMSYSNSALPEPLKVGRYCSIGSYLVFLDSTHPTKLLTSSVITFRHDNILCNDITTPQQVKAYGWHPHASSFPKIGHDVWIGRDVTLAMGINIGTGSIIAARSVVTKDVPPYSLVAGNPAQVKKLRFTERTIERLLSSRWWDCDPRRLAEVGFDDIDRAIDFAETEIGEGRTFRPVKYIMTQKAIVRVHGASEETLEEGTT